MIEVTTSEFDARISGSDSGPYLVDFWSPICGRCYALRPQLEGGLGDEDHAMAINVFDEPELAERYDVKSLPVVLLIDSGKVVGRYDDPILSTQVIEDFRKLQTKLRLAR